MTLMQTSAPATAPDDGLSFDATVPRELVHKQSVHEVLLTDARQLGEHRFVTAGELPRTHSFYSDGSYNDGVSIRYDTMLPMELKRQSGVLIAHRWYDIPQGHRFVFLGIDLAVQHPEALSVGGAPALVVMTTDIVDRKLRGDTLTAYTLDTAYRVDGIDACTSVGSVMFMPRPAYEAMRRKQREARDLPPDPPQRSGRRRFPVAPSLLGRHNETNVVLSGLARDDSTGRCEADVVVDDRHPCLFDHRLDHVPGMLLLEAGRQIAVAATADRLGVSPTRLVVTGTGAGFASFAELDLPLTCDATVETPGEGDADIKVTTRLRQSGETVSDGHYTFTLAA